MASGPGWDPISKQLGSEPRCPSQNRRINRSAVPVTVLTIVLFCADMNEFGTSDTSLVCATDSVSQNSEAIGTTVDCSAWSP